jgi:CBS domain-containing protein
MGEGQNVQEACAAMCRRRAGSVLVVGPDDTLTGIFTGRDALRVLAECSDPASTTLDQVMTRNPLTIAPSQRAIDALRIMSDGGFRHLPVVQDGRIWGVVSRADFKGVELDRLDEDERLAECLW